MSNITWRLINPLLDKSVIDVFEQKNDISLPRDVKECIQQYNAGYPYPDIIKTNGGEEIEIGLLLSYNQSDRENIYNVFSFFQKSSKKNVLPLFTTSTNDYICLDLTSESILYWQEQTNRFIFICDNFNEFLNQLYFME